MTSKDTLVDAEGGVVGDEHDVAVAEPQLHLTVRIFYSQFLFFLPCPNNVLSPALLPQPPPKRLNVKNGGPRTLKTTPRRTLSPRSPRSPSTSPTTTQNPTSSLICSPSARGWLQKKSHVLFLVSFFAAHFFARTAAAPTLPPTPKNLTKTRNAPSYSVQNTKLSKRNWP